MNLKSLKAKAELILFVIPKSLRSIAGMTEAVELVSGSRALLLVIEPMEGGYVAEDGVFITGRNSKIFHEPEPIFVGWLYETTSTILRQSRKLSRLS
uniref:Uncharacterized protein n=1 Tax=Peronospora matthiolae TaxID=2874970 RepID=A0AAV1UR45_9STRA